MPRINASNLELALFSVLMAMGLIHFGLCFWVYRRIRTRHPAIYEEFGSPGLFWNRSRHNQRLLWKFMSSPRVKELSDPTLARVAVFIRVFGYCYLLIFGCLFASTLRG